MPKQRLTCTRCSQRRQKCDRKVPCSRCVQNHEGHLCTTKWVDGYNPTVHRKYPRKSSPSISWQSTVSSNETSSSQDASPATLQLELQASRIVQEVPSRERIPDGDACATIAWPTRLPDITIEALLSGKDQGGQQGPFDQSFKYVQFRGVAKDCSSSTCVLSSAARAAETQHLQSILPSKTKTIQIVEYYEKYMLYWIGGLYHGPSFRRKLQAAYGSSDAIDLQSLDWKWTALLFSILSSGIIGSSEADSVSWGFSIDDKVKLAREWGAATVSCLNLGSYMSQYALSSVQAIYIMHAYAHLVGSSNQWSALRGVAIIIAKGLGLHRLAQHPDDNKVHELDTQQKDAFIEREIGRRTWYNLVTQDWLCSTSHSTYVIQIQRRHFTTARPQNLDEETMLPIGDDRPTFPSVGGYFFEYATLIMEFHTGLAAHDEDDDATRYAQLLKFDGDMRATCAETVPKFLSPRTPLNPSWPKWTAWSRKMHQASVNHKIIMLHQTFLSKSFKDVRYTYTRWACATAAKNIISIYTTREPQEPQWWIEQAFIVTAAICLVLDLFNRGENEPEAQEYQALVQKAITILQQFFTSSVALHGTKLLASLLQEYSKTLEGSRSNATQVVRSAKACPFLPCTMTEINLPESERANPLNPLPSDPDVPLSQDEAAQFNFDIDSLGFDDLMDYLPAETGLHGNTFYESICEITGQSQSSW